MRFLRALIPIPLLVAAYGWQDMLLRLPGPKLPLAMPLRETGGQADVPVIGFFAVWVISAALVTRIAPPRRLDPFVSGIIRGALTFAVLLPIQALSIQLVRQAETGFDWTAALRSPGPWLSALCLLLVTPLFAPKMGATESAAEQR